jgi:hypothetical protein
VAAAKAKNKERLAQSTQLTVDVLTELHAYDRSGAEHRGAGPETGCH